MPQNDPLPPQRTRDLGHYTSSLRIEAAPWHLSALMDAVSFLQFWGNDPSAMMQMLAAGSLGGTLTGLKHEGRAMSICHYPPLAQINCIPPKFCVLGVPIVAQRVKNLTSIYANAVLIPGLAHWVKHPVLP